MNRWLALVAGVLVVAPLALLSGSATAAAAQAPSDITVVLDKHTLDAGPGEKITFRSTVRNTGDQPETDLVAHLNILTTDPDVYVDPEDWSPTRTQYLDLAPGDSKSLTWDVQAVTSGPLILYVSVTSPSSDRVSSSGPLNLTVGGQRVVDSGTVLPLVLWMPSGVLALAGATLVRRRRHR
jgi:uncharacterized membrane protein